ncbi:MAG: PIN domain-containing protein [Planctomycetes bacterium]|nr:PIN domain-containing protein [Planctomycetota bacterium]
MSAAVDTNILVYARREESAHHREALSLLRGLAEGPVPWAIPWPCVYEFLRIVTHPRIFHPPTTLGRALEDLRDLGRSPTLRLLGPTERHVEFRDRVLLEGRASGNLVHDGHIVALALEHGFDEILSTDEDLRRFPSVRVRNPFR